MNNSFWSVWGKFYGYPQCCVDEMLHFYTNKPEGYSGYGQFVGTRKLDGTGFIPCTQHNKLKTKHLVTLITSKRICSKPFPGEGRVIEDLKEVLNSNAMTAFQKRLLSNEYRKEIVENEIH